MIDTLRERHLLSMVAPAAILRRRGRIDGDEGSPSFFRFGGHSIKELRPGRVTDTLGKAMVMHHAVDVQVLHTDHPETVYDLARLLMGEVITSEPNPLMNTRYDFAMLPTLRCALCQRGMFALYPCQCLFFRAKELGVHNLFSIGKGREGF